MAARRELTLFLLLAVAGWTQAFLATSLNTSDPDVAWILCPEQTTGVTRDHKWITREAIRRNLRQFFLDYPPASEPGFNVPTDASLTELYHAYYGAAASPARFIKAVNSIAASNVKADSLPQLKYDPEIQGDGEDLQSLQDSMATRYPQILTSILQDEAYTAARTFIGLTLHSLQKFYSHSTWVEQGNKGILEDLGLPGFLYDDLAGASDDVCSACSSPQGACAGNVIKGVGLSSGYYQYDDPAATSILIPKPTTEGKCSHGGVLDDSSSVPAEGGINKDTASPCFSPHYHLHEQAAELAVQATVHYLNVLLDAVGNDKYRRLFDLYHGSALSIAIDTTGSMSDDIAAVKQQVQQIVDSTSAELFILSPFHDPTVGPGLKTTDPQVFMDAVNDLTASGGCCGIEEKFWGGLQLALSMTPNYGDIFCFTDAGGNDGELMQGDIAVAQQQHNKVTIIYSFNNRDNRDNSDNRDNNRDGGARDSLTGVDEYQYLADSTGGLFIPSDKFDIDAITPILGEGVESQSVDVTMVKGLTGPNDLDLPIDDAIFDFEIRLSGTLTTALLRDITGTEYDLTNEASLDSDPNIEIIAYSPSLKAIRWLSPRYGQWSFHTDSSSTYSISVSANSTLSFMGDFSILDPRPPHPHYQLVEGRPLINTVYYIDVVLVGYLESGVTDVNKVEYVDKSGTLLRTIPYHGDVDDEFYIRSEPLPEEPFYIKLYGHVESGNVFCRLLSVIMSPVETSVGVLATADDLSARPGETATGDFIVANFGLDSYFTITGTDDKGYLVSISPDRIFLKFNESGIVTGHFSVGSSETPGTVSIITVTAQSETQIQSVNSAISQFLVLPLVTDVDTPTCETSSSPDCTGFNLNGICSEKNWTISASLQDTKSGLSVVYARPDGFQTDVSSFSPGTTSTVSVTYYASCCTTQVDIIGVDVQGNIGKCQIDMGTLGGYVFDFEAVSEGTTWVYLRWSITPTEYDIHKYTLLINNDFTEDVRCPDLICYHNVTYLDPCSLQTFKITPVFTVSGSDRAGEPAFTDANTLDNEPVPPENGRALNFTETTVTIAWDGANTKCVSQYEVCYRPFGFTASEVCERTSLTTYKMRGLEACAAYEVVVTSLSPLGVPSSDALTFFVNTDEALPGAPRNMAIPTITNVSATITWEDPLDRAQCIDRYVVSFKENEIVKAVTPVAVKGEHMVIIQPLEPCKNYTFDVAALSKSGYLGPLAERYESTLETDPVPVWSLELAAASVDSLDASWKFSTACVDHFYLCFYDDEEVGLTCEDVYESTYTLSALLACTTYHVSVSTVTPSGVMSDKIWQSSDTLDLAPGEPQNLRITKETAHSIDIQYDPPIINPQCTVEYDIEVIDLGVNEKMAYRRRETRLDSVFHDLEACRKYEARVRATSRGQLHSAWVTAYGNTSNEITSEPVGLQLLSATKTSLTVAWFRPETNPDCVLQYELQWSSDAGETGSQTISGPLEYEVEATITGLSPCTGVDLSVTAVSAAGASPAQTLATTTLC
ncbi:von Willebrand factor A domain-containing protein 7-like [Penaeus japonicus]|uniref:von Willebrand factor A domain-containing protein 7-like n=1 Tax=Penaeus japonicus TaxID=27405 RepID=UPI001C70DEF8|nr:von Willebrand factor A domain-containing protein 7-like [Penaeus japonicus]